MLLGIPKIISPDLLKVLMEMGHGDEIVLADANFPAASHAQRLVRCDGHAIPDLLDAILQLFPLDPYVAKPAALMELVPGDTVATPIWDTYASIIGTRSGLDCAVRNGRALRVLRPGAPGLRRYRNGRERLVRQSDSQERRYRLVPDRFPPIVSESPFGGGQFFACALVKLC